MRGERIEVCKTSGTDFAERMQYQTLRSVSDVHVFVLCYDGTFYETVPHDVRKQGPWQGNRRGAVAALKYGYRLALARDGYVLARCEAAVFKPEARCGILRDRISLGVHPN